MYELYAVVCHVGQMEGGHYISYIRCVPWTLTIACTLALERLSIAGPKVVFS